MQSVLSAEAETTDCGDVFIRAEWNCEGQNWLVTITETHWFGSPVIANATFDTHHWFEIEEDVTGRFEQEVTEAFVRAFEAASSS